MRLSITILSLFLSSIIYGSGCYDLMGNISFGPFLFHNTELNETSYGINTNLVLFFFNAGFEIKKTEKNFESEFFGGIGIAILAQIQYSNKGNLRLKSEYPITELAGCNTNGLKFLRNGLQLNGYIQKSLRESGNYEFGLGLGITI